MLPCCNFCNFFFWIAFLTFQTSVSCFCTALMLSHKTNWTTLKLLWALCMFTADREWTCCGRNRGNRAETRRWHASETTVQTRRFHSQPEHNRSPGLLAKVQQASFSYSCFFLQLKHFSLLCCFSVFQVAMWVKLNDLHRDQKHTLTRFLYVAPARFTNLHTLLFMSRSEPDPVQVQSQSTS